MKLLALLATCAALAGCAHSPQPVEPIAALLDDTAFGPPMNPPVDASSVLAMSEPMRRYAERQLHDIGAARDPRRALVKALYSKTDLRLAYDTEKTRTAAESFEARSGNCLSLALMTAAFARHLGLPARFQSVEIGDSYSRVADLQFRAGHVNLRLDRPIARDWIVESGEGALIVDFVPASELRTARTHDLDDTTVIAMFMNNRAAELLASGANDDAYAWARAAVLQDPSITAAVNTLSVIYLRSGHLAQAERALRRVLRVDTESTPALSNLILVLTAAGRAAEAEAARQRLAQIQPYPPFHFFDEGVKAMSSGDYRLASQFFARELRRQPYQDEVHFAAAIASLQLGDNHDALTHLRVALENSSTRSSHDLYAAKLEHLRGLRLE